MIDTVVFRIHDLQKHLSLVEWLDRQLVEAGSQGKTIQMQRFTAADEYTPQQKILHRNLITYHNTGEVHEVAHFNHLKSSHYLIAYKIDYNQGFVEFNLSVPKYLFGTNVLHYNTAPTHRNFSAYEHGTLQTNLKEAHSRLIAFLDYFFNEQFGAIGHEIDKRFVEIHRIDLCFNQVFASKDEALDYFNQLRKLKKKNAREGSNYSRDWKTTIMYKTQRYSIKVYHKGTEFKKNDAKQLRKLNAAGGTYDVQHYQDFADTILRYEMTFRNSYMSYLYMNNIFRKDCHIWKWGKALFKKNKTKKAGNNYMQYRASLTADDKRHIDYVSNRINKTKQFYLAVNPDIKEYDSFTDEYEFTSVSEGQQYFSYPALFSARLMGLMGRRFLACLKEFELNLKQDSTTILTALEKHNSEIQANRKKLKAHDIETKGRTGRKISVSKIRAVLKLLETHTFEQIEQAGIFEARTWYNLRKDLESLGVTQQSLGGFTTSAAMDLHAYNGHILYYSQYLGIKHLL